MCHTQGSNLAVTGFVTIEKKQIGDAIIETSESNAALVNHRNAPHQRDLRQLRLERPQMDWRETLWRGAEMQDIWEERGCDPHDKIQIVRKRQCGFFRCHRYCRENFAGFVDGLLAR